MYSTKQNMILFDVLITFFAMIFPGEQSTRANNAISVQ